MAPPNAISPPSAHANRTQPLLSICIATFNRARFIAETLDSIAPQLNDAVEVVIVDGASSDDTQAVVTAFLGDHPDQGWRYVREITNSGVDADYDKAVIHATGRYCWLMTDDDLLRPDAVQHLIDALANEPDVVVVNSCFKSPDLLETLDSPRLKAFANRTYRGDAINAFLEETIFYVTYIGACVFRRDFWLARDRQRYFGTGFAHIGVLCQAPLPIAANLIAIPLIDYRHGNALWRPQAFDIWMVGWPRLVTSFTAISAKARAAANDPSPLRGFQLLSYHLAVGSNLDRATLDRFVFDANLGYLTPLARALAALPRAAVNTLLCLYASLFMRQKLVVFYDLLTSPNAGTLSWLTARLARLPGPLLRAVARQRHARPPG